MTSSTESMADAKTVGLVGVGRMGRCMLERLRKAGYDVVAFDPFPDTWPYIEEQGARRMESHAELARNASLVVMSLPASKHVLEAVRGLEDGVGPEHIIVDTSTVDPETAREAAALMGKHGARFVDAPVLGRPGTVGLCSCRQAATWRRSISRGPRWKPSPNPSCTWASAEPGTRSSSSTSSCFR